MEFRLVIETDNEAFGENPTEAGGEVARILEKLASELREGSLLPGETGRLKDINGNTVGGWEHE